MAKPGIDAANVDAAPIARKWLTVAEACKIYSFSKSWLYAILEEGELPSASIPKRNKRRGLKRISVEALDAFFKAHTTPKPKANGKEAA